MVIGDIALDEFVVGETERISREAPVIILKHTHTHQFPGGAANTMLNLAKLGAKCLAVGVCGEDEQGHQLLSLLQENKIETDLVFSVPNRKTLTKTRISAHSRQSVTQQIVRIDRKPEAVLADDLLIGMYEKVVLQSHTVKGIICSDYGDGIFAGLFPSIATQHRLVAVDAQQGLGRFAGATIFTPNIPEAELAVGFDIRSEEALQKAGIELLNQNRAQNILITRGEQGMALFQREPNGVTHYNIAACNQTEVFDVTGAGDTVVATLTLALAIGATALEAAVLGNIAASLVVRKFGTATTNIAEIQEFITRKS
jgi:rfaE bifunctional protein kinase chain/domain